MRGADGGGSVADRGRGAEGGGGQRGAEGWEGIEGGRVKKGSVGRKKGLGVEGGKGGILLNAAPPFHPPKKHNKKQFYSKNAILHEKWKNRLLGQIQHTVIVKRWRRRLQSPAAGQRTAVAGASLAQARVPHKQSCHVSALLGPPPAACYSNPLPAGCRDCSITAFMRSLT